MAVERTLRGRMREALRRTRSQMTSQRWRGGDGCVAQDAQPPRPPAPDAAATCAAAAACSNPEPADPSASGPWEASVDLGALIDRAKADPEFTASVRRFAITGARSWLVGDEAALHYGVGAFLPGRGRMVEIGSFEGASASYSAAGLRARGEGLLTCIDPHLGGPPWLGVAPWQRTLEAFRATLETCRVTEWVDLRIGDSRSVAAVWPARELDSDFIDADHSFRGALVDLECFGPKLRPGGLVMVDDADDPALPELLDLVEAMKDLPALRFLALVDGVAVFQRTGTPDELLGGIEAMSRGRGLRRPWDLRHLHALTTRSSYCPERIAGGDPVATAYQLAFLARTSGGDVAYSPTIPAPHRAMIEAVASDRGDCRCLPTGVAGSGLRAVVCTIDEAAELAPRLQPGGVLLTSHSGSTGYESSVAVRVRLLEAGLVGCGWLEEVHWGIWRPEELSVETVVARALGDLEPADGAASAGTDDTRG